MKLPLYAEAGVPEVWIVDVGQRQIEVNRQPGGDSYQSVELFAREDTITATQLSLRVKVSELIG